jgi:hypothetical protein
MALRNGSRIGIALGAEEATGVVLGQRGAPCAKVPVSWAAGTKDPGADLLRAFGDLKGALEEALGASTDGASVSVALLPPLADARLVSFPPMRRAEVKAVLSRDVARYFLGANRPRVVGVLLPRGNGKSPGEDTGPSISVLAAAASLSLLESARTAIDSVGWRGVSFSSAHGAWVESARSAKNSPASIVAIASQTAHILRLFGKDVVAVRQVSARDLEAVVQAVGQGGGQALVLASPQEYEDLRHALAGAGFKTFQDPEGWPGVEEATAARAGSSPLELIPPTLARERARRARSTVIRLVAGAAALTLASLGAQLWGAHRELDAVLRRREAIRAEVAPLLEVRDSLNNLQAAVRSLEDLSRSSPVWTRSLVELSALLPQDTYLTGLFASGDTVEIEAAGADAGEAIQILREAGLFEEVRLQGLVERELENGETVVERFRLWARLPEAGKEGAES